DGGRRLCSILQRIEADFVGVGEGGFLAGDGAHADALLDVEAAGLDDPFLEAPALGARVLEIKVGVIDAARGERAEDALELARGELEGGEERLGRGFQNQCILLLALAVSAARTSAILSPSISART